MVKNFLRKGKGTVVDHVAPRFALLEAGPGRLAEVIEKFFEGRDVKLKECGQDVYRPSTGEEMHMPRYDVYVPGGVEFLGVFRAYREHWEEQERERRHEIAKADEEIVNLEKNRTERGFVDKLLSAGEMQEKKDHRHTLQVSLEGLLVSKTEMEEQLAAFEAGQPYTCDSCGVNSRMGGDVEFVDSYPRGRAKVWPYKRALVITTTDTLKKGLHGTFDDNYGCETDGSSVTISSRLLDKSAYQLAQALSDYIQEQLPGLTIALHDHQDVEFYRLHFSSLPSIRKVQFVLYEEPIKEE